MEQVFDWIGFFGLIILIGLLSILGLDSFLNKPGG